MASLMCDLHFWTLRDDVVPKDTDQGTFKYYDKPQHKSMLERHYGQDKLTFSQGRGQVNLIESKRLKSSLKELEEVLGEQAVIFTSWRSSTFLQLVMSSGLIINIILNKLGDIERITYDKFLVGKLLEYITDIVFTSKVIVVTYLESRVTLVTLGKPIDFKSGPLESLAQADPKVQLVDLLGPPGRRMNRKILLSPDSSYCLFWWSINGQEVFPWTPNLNEEDRANIILYSLKGKKGGEPKRLGFARTNSDPVQIRFIGDRTILLVGQDATRHGEVQVDSALLTYFDGDRQLRRSRANRLSLTSSIKCSVCVNDYLVVVSTADGTVLLIDISHNKIECQTKATFIPTHMSLHPDKIIVIAANEKGLLQGWDVALNPIHLEMSSEADFNLGVSHVIDIGHNFNRVPVGLCELKWCERSKHHPSAMEAMAFNYLLVRFQNGPLALLRFSGGVLANSGALGPTQIVNQHMKHRNYHASLLLLNQLDWPSQGESILICINAIFHKLVRQTLWSKENESLMEMCLGLFYSPNRPIPEDTIDEFSEQVHDITRKFFFKLMRHGQVAKAFKLAVDINDYDLFMDIHHYSKRNRMPDLADAALVKAKSIFSNTEGQHLSDGNGSSGEDEDDEEEEESNQRLLVSSLPRPSKMSLPGPMKLFSATIQASATPAIAVLDEPSSLESATMQPQISATFLRTTAAKRISTNEYQTKADIAPPRSMASATLSGSLASLPRGMAEQATKLEKPEDIKVIHFGVV